MLTSDGIVYLEADDIIALYAELFGCSFDTAAAQLLDRGGLEGGLARPRWYGGMGEDLALQAAALTHAIAEGQRFIEGNKRTALVALGSFLRLNGYRLAPREQELATWILDLSRGLTIQDLAGSIRQAMEPISEAS
ncbi:MAG: type II toxin-antitoxin system death-on-curing family toxin [Chloroflexota bacterium]